MISDVLGTGLLVLALVLGVLNSALSVFVLAFSAPARVRRLVNECNTDMDVIQSQWELKRAELAALADAVDTSKDQLERKRRSVTASVSRLEGPASGVPESEEDMLRRMRKSAGLI